MECIPNGSSEVIALINTNGEGQATFEDLVEVLEKIRDLLLRDYDISLTVGLDGVVKIPRTAAVYIPKSASYRKTNLHWEKIR